MSIDEMINFKTLFLNKGRFAIFGCGVIFALAASMEYRRSDETRHFSSGCTIYWSRCQGNLRTTTIAFGLCALLLFIGAGRLRLLDESPDTTRWKRLTKRIAWPLTLLQERAVNFALAASIPLFLYVAVLSVVYSGAQSVNWPERVFLAVLATASLFSIGLDLGFNHDELKNMQRDVLAMVTALVFLRIRAWAGWSWAEVGQTVAIMVSALAVWNGLGRLFVWKDGSRGS